MTDTTDDSVAEAEAALEAKVRTIDEQETALKAEAETAGKALMSAIITYVEAVKKHHGFTRWREGFDQGWAASREYLREEVKKSFEKELRANVGTGSLGIGDMGHQMGGGVSAHTDANMGMMTWVPAAPAPPPTMPTANELVLQFIHENPGRRGVEIAAHFHEYVFRLPERTVRTALHRLKMMRPAKIKIVDGRWYAAEAAPADPQLSLKE